MEADARLVNPTTGVFFISDSFRCPRLSGSMSRRDLLKRENIDALDTGGRMLLQWTTLRAWSGSGNFKWEIVD